MSKSVREFFDAIKESRVVQEIGAELKQQLAHGSHEMAAVLFRGDGFVMYPRTNEGKEDQQHGLPPEATKQPEVERGGMEM